MRTSSLKSERKTMRDLLETFYTALQHKNTQDAERSLVALRARVLQTAREMQNQDWAESDASFGATVQSMRAFFEKHTEDLIDCDLQQLQQAGKALSKLAARL